MITKDIFISDLEKKQKKDFSHLDLQVREEGEGGKGKEGEVFLVKLMTDNKQQQTTTNNNKQQQTTTNNNKQQQTTTINNSPNGRLMKKWPQCKEQNNISKEVFI